MRPSSTAAAALFKIDIGAESHKLQSFVATIPKHGSSDTSANNILSSRDVVIALVNTTCIHEIRGGSFSATYQGFPILISTKLRNSEKIYKAEADTQSSHNEG